MRLLKFCFLTMIVLTTVSAHGLCQLNLVAANTAVNLNINKFPTLDIRVERHGECANFYITIDNGGFASYAKRALKAGDLSLPIQFYKDSGRTKILKDEFETSAGELITGTFSGADTPLTSQNFVYYPFVDPAKYASVGHYTGNFTLKLFEGDPVNSRLADSKIVNFGYLQNRAADISLTETAKGANIVLVSNSGFSISMSSHNGGRLKHADSQKFVPYTVKVDGIRKSILTEPVIVKSAAGVSPIGEMRLPVAVTIGDLNSAPPGQYSDTISITVASNE